MRAFVSVVVFLAAVFEQANSLNCNICMDSASGTDCNGTSVKVPDNVTKCISGKENNTLGDSVIITSFRYFLDTSKPDICGQTLFLTADGFDLSFSYEYCATDDCNTGIIKGPVIDLEPSGIKCPTCITTTENEICVPTKNITCTGNQGECAVFTGTAKRPGQAKQYYNIQGCISTGGCTIGLASLPATVPVDYVLTCSTPAK